MKYTILDLFLSRFRWYRRLTRLYWARGPNHVLNDWVKFSEFELDRMKRLNGIGYNGFIVEDWRKYGG